MNSIFKGFVNKHAVTMNIIWFSKTTWSYNINNCWNECVLLLINVTLLVSWPPTTCFSVLLILGLHVRKEHEVHTRTHISYHSHLHNYSSAFDATMREISSTTESALISMVMHNQQGVLTASTFYDSPHYTLMKFKSKGENFNQSLSNLWGWV